MINWFEWKCVSCHAVNKEGVAAGVAFPPTMECAHCESVYNTKSLIFSPSFQQDASSPSSSVDALLVERGNAHGDFRDNADHAKRFLDILKDSEETRRFRNQIPLTAVQYNAAVMICQKLSRILAGDAAFEDHWIDIQGYAKLGQKGDKP